MGMALGLGGWHWRPLYSFLAVHRTVEGIRAAELLLQRATTSKRNSDQFKNYSWF
jgi:hypothetical protein